MKRQRGSQKHRCGGRDLVWEDNASLMQSGLTRNHTRVAEVSDDVADARKRRGETSATMMISVSARSETLRLYSGCEKVKSEKFVRGTQGEIDVRLNCV